VFLKLQLQRLKKPQIKILFFPGKEQLHTHLRRNIIAAFKGIFL
jgi:hypothetical protein